MIVCFNKFEKISLDPSLVPATYLSLLFWLILNLMGVPTKALQNFFVFQRQKCKIGDFKLKILICCKSLIIKPWTPFHQTPHIFPILLWNWAIFLILEVLGEGLQMFFQLQKQRTMRKDSISFVFLSVCSQAYLPYYNLLKMIIFINSHLRIQVCFIKIIEHVNSSRRMHKVCHYPLQLNLDINTF